MLISKLSKSADEKFAALAEDVAAIETSFDKLDAKIDKGEERLTLRIDKIDRLDTKLGKFEDSEIDKRKQHEVRVAAIERHFGLDNKIAA